MSTPPRRAISKRVRFTVFARDLFTCRYCGRQSDTVVLVIDHVVPIVDGGTNDIENLITACEDCNQGKAGRSPTSAAPNEADRLRLAQERNEQLASFRAAQEAVQNRSNFRDLIVDLWCDIRGTEEMDGHTLNVIARYAEQYGIPTVSEWIQSAHDRLGAFRRDEALGKYISGIRRRKIEQGDLEE